MGRKEDTVVAWWFGGTKLGYQDKREVKIGRTHTIRKSGTGDHLRVVACARGLHASVKLEDAVGYYTGQKYLYLVELSGDMDITYDDKIAARNRKYLSRISQKDLVNIISDVLGQNVSLFSKKMTLIEAAAAAKEHKLKDFFDDILYGEVDVSSFQAIVDDFDDDYDLWNKIEAAVLSEMGHTK